METTRRRALNVTWFYVALVYAAAVWLARRAGSDLPWRTAALFYALVLLFLLRPMTQEYVNLPVDFLQTLPPWAYLTKNPRAANGELNDLALQIAPWAHQVRESWKSLDVPLWNALSGSGYPLLGNAQSSAFSLLRLLALPLPLGYAFTAEAAWKILIALTFTYLFCRRRGYSPFASASGAVAFGFSTFIVVWLHFPLATAAVFVPAVLYQIDLLVERLTYKRFVFAVALWVAMLFSGHPETVSHTFFIALLYLAWILVVEKPLGRREATRFVLVLGSAMVLAALVAAPLLVTFAEGLKKSKRYHELQVQPNVIGYYSDFPSQVVLFQPHFFGAVPHEPAWGPARAESITGFPGVLGYAAWFAILIDVIARRRWRSREAFFLIATLIVLGIILAWPVVSTLFHLVFKLAANARLRLLLCFTLAVLAAAMIDSIERRSIRAPLGGLAIASAMLMYLMYATDFPNDWARDTAMLAILPSLAVIAVTVICGGAAAALQSGGTATALQMAPVLVAIVAELWAVGREWNPTVPAKLMYPSTPLIEKLHDLHAKQPKNDPFRIVGTGPVFFSNAPAVYGFEDIRAHDPMSNGNYLGVLRVIAGYDTGDYFAKWENFETALLDYLNVKYVIAPPGAEFDPSRYALVYDGRDGRIFENLFVLPRFYPVPVVVLDFKRDHFVRRLIENDERWSHTVVLRKLEVENDRMRADMLWPRPPNAPLATMEMLAASKTEFTMRVNAPRYTIVVSSIPWWPGWKIERNGEDAEPIEVNGAFLGFWVRPGVTNVRVYYDPWSFKAGALVSALTLAGLAAPFARSRLRRGRSPARSE